MRVLMSVGIISISRRHHCHHAISSSSSPSRLGDDEAEADDGDDQADDDDDGIQASPLLHALALRGSFRTAGGGGTPLRRRRQWSAASGMGSPWCRQSLLSRLLATIALMFLHRLTGQQTPLRRQEAEG